MGKPRVVMQQEVSHRWFSSLWWFYRRFHVRPDWYIRTPKELWKEHQEISWCHCRVCKFLRGQNALIFVHDLQVFASPNFEDDVIYLRTLCLASCTKSDRYIINELLACPRLRDDPCRYSFNLPQTIRFVSEPYEAPPTIMSSNLTLSLSGITFGNGTAGCTFCIFFQSFFLFLNVFGSNSVW